MLKVTEPNLNENALALICITIVSTIGIVSNSLSLYITTTYSHFRNAYGTLCTAVLLCNIQTISIILIWGAIILMTNSNELSSTSLVALIPGCLVNVSLYGAVLLNLLIAINRYCAFAYPLKYQYFWSVQKARKAGIIVYFLGFLPCFPSIVEPCTLIFNAKSYCWSYCNTTCGLINSIFDMIIVLSSSVIMGCINLVTFIKIRNHHKPKITPITANNFMTRKRDLFFFKQSCVTAIMMIISSIIFFIGNYFLSNKWVVFGVCTIFWEMTHALEGFIVLAFNWHYFTI
ncbi:Serpentine receptor class X [Dirofilaria immitis]